jgi:hypothetical protein
LKARTPVIRLIGRDLTQGIVETVDQALGTRLVAFGLALEVSLHVEGTQRHLGPSGRRAVGRFSVAATHAQAHHEISDFVERSYRASLLGDGRRTDTSLGHLAIPTAT